ncbi:MAG: ATP-binding protein [Nitrospirota bacterium]
MKLKIWHKMIIGIAIPSLIALIGGFLTYKYINDVDVRQRYIQMADDLREHVLEVRRNEKNFFHYKNREYLDNFHKAVLDLQNFIKDISKSAGDELGHAELINFHRTLDEYIAPTSKLITYYQQETDITERVRTEGRRLETYAEKGEHAEDLSTNFILNLRLLEKNYMLFRSRESYQKLNSGLSQLENFTPFCYTCRPYTSSIRELFRVHKEIDSLESSMRQTGQALEDLTGKISSIERGKISLFIAHSKRLMLLALILLCTLGPLFVYVTSNLIVAPVKRLAVITKKISEGDMTLRAPIREHDETYTLAVSFNTMLDTLQLTHHSLEKSLELLHEKQAQLVESEKRASLGLLVSGVAHELNNPLNNISLTAEYMKEDIGNLSIESLEEYIDDILMQSERAQHIVVDLLDFARARRYTGMEQLDIVRVVKESFRLVLNQLRVKEIKLVQNIPDTPIFVMGNRSKLEQVLISIMINAVQAMKEGGVLTVTVEPGSGKDTVQIKIGDTGEGIAKEEIKNIFEPFYTTKAVGEGTGLGLAVGRSLIIEHKGDITVESEPEHGAMFTITLPVYIEASGEELPHPPGPSDKERIHERI